jgi:tRNA U34 5-methylaminomethyl-2-thiouridine-forming methyltransferase MnmC
MKLFFTLTNTHQLGARDYQKKRGMRQAHTVAGKKKKVKKNISSNSKVIMVVLEVSLKTNIFAEKALRASGRARQTKSDFFKNCKIQMSISAE